MRKEKYYQKSQIVTSNMRNFILAGHGKISSGIASSVSLIIGKKDNLHIIDAYNEPEFDLQQSIDTLMEKLEGETIVITDIKGGSVNNTFVSNCSRYQYTLIHTMSLPLVISLLTLDTGIENTEELIQLALQEVRTLDGVGYFTQETQTDVEDDDF